MKNFFQKLFGDRKSETMKGENEEISAASIEKEEPNVSTKASEGEENIIFDIKDEAFRPMAEKIAEKFVSFLQEYNFLEEPYADKYTKVFDNRSDYEKQQGWQTDEMRAIVEEFRAKKEAFVSPYINGIHWRADFQKPAKFAAVNNGGTLTFTMKSKAKITADLATGSDYGIDCYRFSIRPKEEDGWEITSFSYRMYKEDTFHKMDL